MSHIFCSEQSRLRSESLYGTATQIHTWLLLEYPGVWKPDAIHGSALPAAIKQQLDAMTADHSIRPLLIRRSHRLSESMRCFTITTTEAECRISFVDLSVCEELPVVDLTSLASHPRARPLDEPLFLVCTHGTHDKCCAKFGIPLYHAAHEAAGDSVWQCSHSGGDRFAGNLLCFPHGLYYGYVTPLDASAVVASYQRGEVYLEKYRGRCCYPKVVQIGEYFVRQQSGRLQLTAFQLDEYEKLAGGKTWRVRFRGADGLYEVTLGVSGSFTDFLTCKSEIARSVRRIELVSYKVTAA